MLNVQGAIAAVSKSLLHNVGGPEEPNHLASNAFMFITFSEGLKLYIRKAKG